MAYKHKFFEYLHLPLWRVHILHGWLLCFLDNVVYPTPSMLYAKRLIFVFFIYNPPSRKMWEHRGFIEILDQLEAPPLSKISKVVTFVINKFYNYNKTAVTPHCVVAGLLEKTVDTASLALLSLTYMSRSLSFFKTTWPSWHLPLCGMEAVLLVVVLSWWWLLSFKFFKANKY